MQLELDFDYFLLKNKPVLKLEERFEHGMNFIYFKIIDKHGYKNNTYNIFFTYKYVTYCCEYNMITNQMAKYQIYDYIIRNLKEYLNESYSDWSVNYVPNYIGKSIIKDLDVTNDVIEIINLSGQHLYYVIHSIKDIDVENVNKINKEKYNIRLDNINFLNKIYESSNDKSLLLVRNIEKIRDNFFSKMVENINDNEEFLRKTIEETFYVFYNVKKNDIVLDSNGTLYQISDLSNPFKFIFDFKYDGYYRYEYKNNKLEKEHFEKYCYLTVFRINILPKKIIISDKKNELIPQEIIHNFGQKDLIGLGKRNNRIFLSEKIDSIYYKYLHNKQKNKKIIKHDIYVKSESVEVNLYDETEDNYPKTKTYLIKNKRNGLYKIGQSINPKYRERTLQSEEPDIMIVKIWDEDIENILHNEYKKERVRGEWFKLNKIQVSYICKKNWVNEIEDYY